MGTAVKNETTSSNIREQVLSLWKRNRLRCGWFLREDFCPETADDFARCLTLLQQHGDRKTYVMARKLRKCL